MEDIGSPNCHSANIRSTRVGSVAPSGFSIDPAEYHRKLYVFLPELYVQDNYSRNFDYEGRFIGRGVFAVDAAWADRFPQYEPFLGEKLSIYLLGGGEDWAQIAAVKALEEDRGLHRGLDAGGVLFAVCAGYQLCGHSFTVGDNDEVFAGLGLLDVETRRGDQRAVGEILT